MPEPIEAPLIPTSSVLVQRAIEQLQAQYPNWHPNPASPEYKMFMAFAAICVEVIVLCFNVPEALIRFVGEVVYQTPPTPAVAATATSTWTAADNLGHMVEAGEVVIVTPEGGTPVAFEVTEDVEIKAGETETPAGAVKLQALEAGVAGNISGATTVEPNELLSWVNTIALATEPDGGAPEETTQEYSRRVRELATLIKPQPILPEDHANYVRLLIPGITRCLAIDELELKLHENEAKEKVPYGGSEVEAENIERCVAVIPLDAAGESPPEATLKAAYERLKGAREATFKSFVGVPTVHPIDVKVAGKFFKGFTKAVVEANMKVALEELLSGAKWGASSSAPGWVNKKTLRYQDVVTAVNNVEGFNFYTELKVNGKEEDIALSGIAPLVKAGTLTITLTEGAE